MTTKLTEREKQKLRDELLRKLTLQKKLINKKYDNILTSASKEYIRKWFSAADEYKKRIDEIDKM